MLITELKKDSPEAFRILVEQYSQDVITICNGFVNNRSDAEDIAQDVFIEIYKSIRRFRGESELYTWIYRICINKSLDFIRKRKRKKRIVDLSQLFRLKSKPVVTPHQKLEENERREILQEQIELLAENQRIALVLSQFDGFSHKKIAEIMETTESAIESLLHRAKGNLRKNLAKYFEKKL